MSRSNKYFGHKKESIYYGHKKIIYYRNEQITNGWIKLGLLLNMLGLSVKWE